jgi:hypothetical protein
MRVRAILSVFVVMLCALNAHAFQDLSNTFTNYKSKNNATRLYLIFDQPSYVPGDTVFFSAWHVNEESKFVKGNYTGTLELVSPSGTSVQLINFKLVDGRGVNQVVIPANVQPGPYRFYAYTNWMRNFGTGWFFRKTIAIEDPAGLKQVAAPVFAAHSEGGSLIAGIANSVVVVGKPNTVAEITDEEGTHTIPVTIDGAGVGKVSFTPNSSGHYFLQKPGGARTPLQTVESGAALRYDSEGNKIVVTTTNNLKDKNLVAVFTSGGKITEFRRFTPTSGSYDVAVPQDNSNGLFYQFFVIDGDGKTIARRVLSRPTPKILTPKANGLAEALQREKLDLKAAVPSQTELNVSVYRKDLFKGIPLKHGFYLSELPDVYDWAEKTPSYEVRLNDYLATQDWSRIDWSRIAAGEKNLKYSYGSQVILRGSVVSRSTGKPAPDSTNVVAYLQKNTMGYDTYTNDGKFVLPFVFDFWQNDYLFFHLNRNSRDFDAEYEVVIEKDAIKWEPLQLEQPVRDVSPYAKYISNNNLIANSYSYFVKPKQAAPVRQNPNASFEDEIGVIDFTVNVQDYVVFPAMEDLIREVMPYVQFRKGGSREGVRILFRLEKSVRVSKGNPLYVIDGVMTKNSMFFLSLKPKDLLTVKIVNDLNRLQQLGKIGDNGVIFVESRSGNVADSLKNANDFPIVGLSRPVEVKYVDHEAKKTPSRVPDLRPVTYWKPSSVTGPENELTVSFYVSDDIAPLTILIQGLTSDGVPVFIEHEVNVEFRQR